MAIKKQPLTMDPADPYETNALSIGAEQSKLARDLMRQQAQQKNVRHWLHGVSLPFSALMGAYHEGQMRDKEKAERDALIGALEGSGASPLELQMAAQGNANVLNHILARRENDRRFERERSEADRLYAREKRDRATARDSSFRQKVQLEMLRAKLRKENPKRKIEKITNQLTGEEYLVEILPDGSWKRVPEAGSTQPRQAASAAAPATGATALRGTTEGTEIAAPAAATTMGVPAAPPGEQAPREGAPANMNIEKLGKERAKFRAKFEAMAPEKREQAIQKYRTAMRQTGSALSALQKISDLIAPDKNQFVEAWLPEASLGTWGAVGRAINEWTGIPTQASELEKNLDPVKAEAAFSRLQEMREASPTGGALGQVTERELDLLKDSFTALDPSKLREPTFRAILNETLDKMRSVQEAAALDYAFAMGEITEDQYRAGSERIARQWESWRNEEQNVALPAASPAPAEEQNTVPQAASASPADEIPPGWSVRVR